MAIDTAAKRKNVSSIGHPYRGPGITPDASKGVAWRYTSGYSYSGSSSAFTQYYYWTEPFDPAEYPTGVFKLITILAATTGKTTYARLVNVTDGLTITEISTTATTPTVIESAALAMPVTAKTLRVEFGTSAGAVARIFGAKVRFDPS